MAALPNSRFSPAMTFFSQRRHAICWRPWQMPYGCKRGAISLGRRASYRGWARPVRTARGRRLESLLAWDVGIPNRSMAPREKGGSSTHEAHPYRRRSQVLQSVRRVRQHRPRLATTPKFGLPPDRMIPLGRNGRSFAFMLQAGEYDEPVTGKGRPTCRGATQSRCSAL